MRESVNRARSISVGMAIAVAIALALSLAPSIDRAQAQGSTTIDIANFAFAPGSVTIEAGTTVTWVNSDSVPHTATGDGGSFDTGNIVAGGSASITFDTPGTYSYFCAIHPDMTASITVIAAGDDGGDDGTDDGTDGGTDDGPTQLPDTGVGLALAGSAVSTGVLVLSMLTALGFAASAVAIRRRVS